MLLWSWKVYEGCLPALNTDVEINKSFGPCTPISIDGGVLIADDPGRDILIIFQAQGPWFFELIPECVLKNDFHFDKIRIHKTPP
jgi:hypothetical protein